MAWQMDTGFAVVDVRDGMVIEGETVDADTPVRDGCC